MTEDWTKWERQIVNGVYPLRRFLGRSNHSVVFLTEFGAQNSVNAAIKLLPADPALAETQLSYWRRAATLSHPHLIRLLDAGRCTLGGHNFLFVVMDYAEENLAQILPQRALTPDEVREMLIPTLDALAFLHRKSLVQGQLKPPNFLVVDDRLKLASDTIRPAGEPRATVAKNSIYDPPEAKHGGMSAAGDLWGLGISLVEALTRTSPAWSGERLDAVSLPASLPPEYGETVRRCLSRDPAHRPTIMELEAQLNPVSLAPPDAPAQPVVLDSLVRVASKHKSSKTRLVFTGITVGIMTLAVLWTGIRLFQAHPRVAQSVGSNLHTSSQQNVSAPAAAENPQQPPVAVLAPVMHEEIPNPSRGARASIHGRILLTVRVVVDRSGNVTAASLQNRRSSRYFARLATEAAKKWKFAPAEGQPARVRLLRFEFTRGGTTAFVIPISPDPAAIAGQK